MHTPVFAVKLNLPQVLFHHPMFFMETLSQVYVGRYTVPASVHQEVGSDITKITNFKGLPWIVHIVWSVCYGWQYTKSREKEVYLRSK